MHRQISEISPIKLDFLIPGFSKCGSTTLYKLLAEHPQIYLPARKDFRYYDLAERSARQPEFEKRFHDSQPGQMVGDASIWYTDTEFEEQARRTILETHPQVKLIFIARDPVDRVESAYREQHHNRLNLPNGCPFDLATAMREKRGISLDSCFGQRLANYSQYVPAERILLLLLEDLQHSPAETVARCFRFLGVDSDFHVPGLELRHNSRSNKYRDTPRLRELKKNPEIAGIMRYLPFDVQTQLLPALGLREKFSGAPLPWDDQARRSFIELIGDDPGQYLRAAGALTESWPRYAQLVGRTA